MLKNVYENKSLFFKGPYNIEFKEGIFDVIGKTYTSGKIIVPEGKTLPVVVKKSGKLEVENDYPAKVKEVSSSVIPFNYEKLVKKILKENIRSILIIGEKDSGKTFLSKYLINKLIEQNKSIGLLDSDVGQSDIGMPGSIGLSILEKNITFLNEAKVYDNYFVGSFSPSLHLVPFLTGIKKMSAISLMNSDVTIIDTTGLISGDAGRLLKQSKIEMLQPELIVLIQKENEAEHIIRGFAGLNIFRLPVPEFIQKKSIEFRTSFKKDIYKKYFENKTSIKLNFRKIRFNRCYLNTGYKLPTDDYSKNILYVEQFNKDEGIIVATKKDDISEADLEILNKISTKIKKIKFDFLDNTVVALLNESGKTLCYGIIDKIDFNRENIHIYIPEKFKNIDISLIVFGSIKYDIDNNRFSYLTPGTI